MRHNNIDQAHALSLGSRIAAAEIPHLARFFLTHNARQIGGAKARIHGTNLRPHLAELRLLRCDGQVTQCRQYVAAANRIALHARDQGLWHIADQALQFFNRQADHAAAIILPIMRALIATSAKGAIARTSQHNHADRFVPTRAVQRMDQFFAGLAAKGIHHLRAIDGDGCNTILRFKQNILIGHDAFPQPAMVRPPETLSTWPVT